MNRNNCTLDAFTKTYINPAVPADYCTNKDNVFFIQYGCQFTKEVEDQRQVQGLVIGCFAVFIALFFLVYIDYIRNVCKNNFIEWDVKTITAGDYSVEYDISLQVW